jgi:DNA-binding CsgD family transcriptional regulator
MKARRLRGRRAAPRPGVGPADALQERHELEVAAERQRQLTGDVEPSGDRLAAAAELEASGVHQRRIVRGGADALTPSERRIAELASGMTNRDIAASPFVTVRTVEAHLGHAYSKLGIPGRAGLAAALERP